MITKTHDQLLVIGHSYNGAHGAFEVVGETLIFPDGFVPTEEECNTILLSKAKKEASDSVDADYERKRQTYLTSGSTMAMVYLLKAAEAKLYQSNPEGSFPFLTASVNAGEAADLASAATYVLGRESMLINLAANLEEERLTKKIAITNATTVAEVNAVLEG